MTIVGIDRIEGFDSAIPRFESWRPSQPMLSQRCCFQMCENRDFIAHTLESGDVFTPLLLEDENGTFPANDWATGFLRGLDLRRKEWAPLLEDEEHAGAPVPIFALAYEHDPAAGK
jgi:yecA family protein